MAKCHCVIMRNGIEIDIDIRQMVIAYLLLLGGHYEYTCPSKCFRFGYSCVPLLPSVNHIKVI